MATPTLHVTSSARAAILAALQDAGSHALRLTISERFEHALSLDEAAPSDVVVEQDGVTIVLDPASAPRADGVRIDFVPGDEAGFSLDNPNQPPSIRQLSAPGLKALMDSGLTFELVDVRTEHERSIACIAGSRLLDQAYHDHLMTLDRETPMVFQCHHGVRSQSAAEYFLTKGFRNLSNLHGGIDAWSEQVDPTIRKY